MKILLAVIALLGLNTACTHAVTSPGDSTKRPVISKADLVHVIGKGWTGKLVYRDYKPPFGSVTLKTEADIEATPDGLSLAIRYPDEPHANSIELISVSKDGTRLGGDPIVALRIEEGTAYVTTRASCEDDNKPAVCEHAYMFGDNVMGIRKTVSFPEDDNVFLRNAYSFTR